MKSIAAGALIGSLLTLLVACGQRGPLHLPEKPQARTTATQPQPVPDTRGEKR